MTDTKGKVVIRFDGPPGHVAGRFVEVERDGTSINYGDWVQDGEYWLLVLPNEPGVETLKELVLANQSAAMNEMGRAKSAEDKLLVADAALKKIQEACTTWKATAEKFILCRETARNARDRIREGIVDKGGVNEPPTSPKPDVMVKPQASRRRVSEGYQPTHGASAGSPPKGGSALGTPKSGEGQVQKLLALAVQYLEHYGPPPPDHSCGNPDSMCDMDCVNFAQFCNDLLEMKGAC